MICDNYVVKEIPNYIKKITILKIETKSLDCEQKGSYYVHSSLSLPNDRFVSERLTIIIR